MGAVFAGAARAPITAVIILFELTGEYSIILPLMLAIVVASAVSARLSPDTIYTLKLSRRGINVRRPRVVSVMRTVPVSAAMGALPQPLTANASLEAVLARFAEGRDDAVPVLDASGAVVSVLGAGDVEALTRDADEHPGREAGLGSRGWPRLYATDTLEEAGRALEHARLSGLPVLAPDTSRPVGWVTHRDVLRAYHDERGRLSPPSASPPPVAAADIVADEARLEPSG